MGKIHIEHYEEGGNNLLVTLVSGLWKSSYCGFNPLLNLGVEFSCRFSVGLYGWSNDYLDGTWVFSNSTPTPEHTRIMRDRYNGIAGLLC